MSLLRYIPYNTRPEERIELVFRLMLIEAAVRRSMAFASGNWLSFPLRTWLSVYYLHTPQCVQNLSFLELEFDAVSLILSRVCE